jgi:hypothetical protein
MVHGVFLIARGFCFITYAHTPVNDVRSYVLNGARSHGFIHMTTTGSAREFYCHMSCPGLTMERVSLLMRGMWPHGPHAPNTSGIWGHFVEMNVGAGFRHGKCPEARLLTHKCVLANQRQQA